MNRAQRITGILTQELHPTRLELRDDSHKHAGHSGAREGFETHFDLIIEAECFRGLNKIQRHQMIYTPLAEEFKTGLHALAIKAEAPGGATR